jgi:Arc/MetJ-type ribon-helix-helix transcriptional regulator
MSGRRSERMANITTTLPIPLLEGIDEMVIKGKVPSRSHVIREAVSDYLKTFQ